MLEVRKDMELNKPLIQIDFSSFLTSVELRLGQKGVIWWAINDEHGEKLAKYGFIWFYYAIIHYSPY
jgi:hypothetical protein